MITILFLDFNLVNTFIVCHFLHINLKSFAYGNLLIYLKFQKVAHIVPDCQTQESSCFWKYNQKTWKLSWVIMSTGVNTWQGQVLMSYSKRWWKFSKSFPKYESKLKKKTQILFLSWHKLLRPIEIPYYLD